MDAILLLSQWTCFFKKERRCECKNYKKDSKELIKIQVVQSFKTTNEDPADGKCPYHFGKLKVSVYASCKLLGRFKNFGLVYLDSCNRPKFYVYLPEIFGLRHLSAALHANSCYCVTSDTNTDGCTINARGPKEWETVYSRPFASLGEAGNLKKPCLLQW